MIGTWANRPEGSLERRVYDEAIARVQASRPDSAAPDTYSSEELLPYAVQVAMELGVQPTALMPANSVQGWLARVRASLQAVLGKLTGNPLAFDGQDLVDLAFTVAQRERSDPAPSQNGEDDSGSTPEKGLLGTENNPRPIPFKEEDLVGLGIAKRVELAGSQALVGERVDSPEQLCLPTVQRLRPMACHPPSSTHPRAATPAPAP